MKEQNEIQPPGKETITLSQDTIRLPYGVGIDTHKKFIQVCILKRTHQEIQSIEFEFSTLRAGLASAKAAIQKQLGLGPEEPFAYTIESTGLYHMPVLIAFGGTPSAVNPLLAGHTRKKTDVLDARLLARQAITGLWHPSYLCFPEQTVLRVMWDENTRKPRKARYGQFYAQMGYFYDTGTRSPQSNALRATKP